MKKTKLKELVKAVLKEIGLPPPTIKEPEPLGPEEYDIRSGKVDPKKLNILKSLGFKEVEKPAEIDEDPVLWQGKLVLKHLPEKTGLNITFSIHQRLHWTYRLDMEGWSDETLGWIGEGGDVYETFETALKGLKELIAFAKKHGVNQMGLSEGKKLSVKEGGMPSTVINRKQKISYMDEPQKEKYFNQFTIEQVKQLERLHAVPANSYQKYHRDWKPSGLPLNTNYQGKCKQCGSDVIQLTNLNPVNWKCTKCGHQWTQQEKGQLAEVEWGTIDRDEKEEDRLLRSIASLARTAIQKNNPNFMKRAMQEIDKLAEQLLRSHGLMQEEHGDVYYWGAKPKTSYQGTKITTGYKKTSPKPLSEQ